MTLEVFQAQKQFFSFKFFFFLSHHVFFWVRKFRLRASLRRDLLLIVSKLQASSVAWAVREYESRERWMEKHGFYCILFAARWASRRRISGNRDVIAFRTLRKSSFRWLGIMSDFAEDVFWFWELNFVIRMRGMCNYSAISSATFLSTVSNLVISHFCLSRFYVWCISFNFQIL